MLSCSAMGLSRQLAWAAAALAAASLSASTVMVRSIAAVVGVAILIASGPASGWWRAITEGRMSTALPLLLLATGLPVVPLALWLRANNHTGFLGLAVLLWFASGWYFTIGMWI